MKVYVDKEDVELAIELLKEYLPSFRDPSHYCRHQHIQLVERLEHIAKTQT